MQVCVRQHQVAVKVAGRVIPCTLVLHLDPVQRHRFNGFGFGLLQQLDIRLGVFPIIVDCNVPFGVGAQHRALPLCMAFGDFGAKGGQQFGVVESLPVLPEGTLGFSQASACIVHRIVERLCLGHQ